MAEPGAAETRWWQRRNGEVTGPYTRAELRTRVSMGALQTGDELCEEGSGPWVRARTISGVFPPWVLVAAHGARWGQWTAAGAAALLILFVLANHPEKVSDGDFWGGWACIGAFVVTAGYGVGYAIGAVAGWYAERADVARAVTATATVGVGVLCLGATAVHWWGTWREDRRLAERGAAPLPAPPPEPRHKGRTAREWVAVYQRGPSDEWFDAEQALTALGTEECVAALARELDTGDSLVMQLSALSALERLAARRVPATRVALPALKRIAAGQPRPAGVPPGPELRASDTQTAVRTVRAIEALR